MSLKKVKYKKVVLEPLDNLGLEGLSKRYGFDPRHSATAVGNMIELSPHQKRNFLTDVAAVHFSDPPKNNYFLTNLTGYLVQDLVRGTITIPITKEQYDACYAKAVKSVNESYIAVVNGWTNPNEPNSNSVHQPVEGTSKQEQATQIYTDNQDKQIDEVVKMLVDQLQLQEATARNYYYTAKRKVNPEPVEFRRDEKTGEVKRVKKGGGRKADPNSKLARACAVYEDGMTREDFVKAAIAAVDGLPENTAVCYYYQAKKRSV